MWKVMLLVCQLGTPPIASNPTCGALTQDGVLHDTQEACARTVPGLVEKMDTILKPKGYEAWFVQGKPCVEVPHKEA